MQAPQDVNNTGSGYPVVSSASQSLATVSAQVMRPPAHSQIVTQTQQPHGPPHPIVQQQPQPHPVSQPSQALPAENFQMPQPAQPPPTQAPSQQHRSLFTAEVPPQMNRSTESTVSLQPAPMSHGPPTAPPPLPAHGMQAHSSGAPFQQTGSAPGGFIVSQPHSMPVALPPHMSVPHRPLSQPQSQQVPVVHMPGGAPSQPTAASGQQQAQQFQRLKVEDALSYLDQVKLQFGNHPQVYNDFLDIMKEFKSQTIDTPGVISRVSNLFKGHPDLIVGFNTFLPPGYKIEVQANDTISVQQPGQPSITLSQLAGQNQPPTQYKPVNLSVNSSGSHQESMRNIDTMVAAGQAAASGSQPTAPGQPVEFNHAINYVNKIKNRFQGQPDIYKNFLEILHTYQKEQRQLKDVSKTKGLPPQPYKPLSETEVYAQVSKLFMNQEDLLKEFGQFLPDANGGSFNWGGKGGLDMLFRSDTSYNSQREHSGLKKQSFLSSSKTSSSNKSNSSNTLRKTGSSNNGAGPPAKKSKSITGSSSYRDVSLAEAGKYGSLSDYAYFDKVRKAVRSQEVYENFLRCLVLFNQEVITRTELVQLIQPFLGKYPELFRKFKDFLGYKDTGAVIEAVTSSVLGGKGPSERYNSREDLAMEIDYSSCKRYGHSYRGLPKSFHPPRCSGRTQLCKEVLNDTWVSFPSWSEESTFVTSRKTQYEENIYRCEDERFELDMVIELNLATVRVLEGVQKKLQRMNSDDAAKFKLDNSLGGSSDIIHRKAIQRIYGDKSTDIIDGLKKNPVVAVPLVLRRLKAKDDEWREAQRQFNKIWREQNDKYYLKSLDHQGISFKQNDVKALRSKSLLNEIEAIYDTEQKARKEAQESAADENPLMAPTSTEAEQLPHLTYTYKHPSLIDDSMGLIIHHVRRQASIQKEDKQKIKAIVRQNVQTLFHRSPVALSDDEDDGDEDDDDEENDGMDSPKPTTSRKTGESRTNTSSPAAAVPAVSASSINSEAMDTDECKDNESEGGEDSDDKYSLFFANNNWYLFLRLHHILCKRLHKIRLQCDTMTEEHGRCKQDKADSTAVALRLKSANDVEPDQYYSTFLELIKSLLDGNIECGYYEDQLREMFGIHAYIAFTLDKVVQNIVKQLQYAVNDDICKEVTDLWIKEGRNKATGGCVNTQISRLPLEQAYQKRVDVLLSEENCFKVLVTQRDLSMNITLLDSDQDSAVSVSGQVTQADKWSEYVDRFVAGGSDTDLSDDVREHLKRTPIFLSRNLKCWKKFNHGMLQKSPAVEKPKVTADDGPEAGPNDADDEEVAAATENLDILEGQACKFNVDSFKMVYVVNSESHLYKRQALTKAQQTHRAVSAVMTERWRKFCQGWRDENATVTEMMRIQDWMEGRDLEDCKPCHTVCHRDNNVDLAPYHPFSRFSVRYEKVTATTVSTVPDDGTLTALFNTEEAMDVTA